MNYEIKAVNKDHNTFRVCLKALDKKNVQFYKKYAIIKDGFVFSTDGFRIHKGKLNGNYDNGMYMPVKNNKSLIILQEINEPIDDYPNPKPCFDNTGMDEIMTEQIFDLDHDLCRLTTIIRCLPIDLSVNPKYISDIDGIYNVKIDRAGNKPILLESEIINIAIMPVQLSL